jgi:hypothetical protein
VEFCGESPSSGVVQDTGWVQETLVVFLDVGTHTLAFGCHGDKKTYDEESTQIYVDDIVVEAQ